MDRTELVNQLTIYYHFAFAYVRKQPNMLIESQRLNGGAYMSGFVLPLAMELDELGYDGASIYRLGVLIEESQFSKDIPESELRVALLMAFYTLCKFDDSFRQPTARGSANDPRDKFIYDERHKKPPTPYSAIIKHIKGVQGWANIGTDPGCREAAKRYAERHNLPPIPLEG